MSTGTYNARLGVRLTNGQRELIEQAAGLLGQSVRDFTVSTVVREAQEVVDRSITIRLSVTLHPSATYA